MEIKKNFVLVYKLKFGKKKRNIGQEENSIWSYSTKKFEFFLKKFWVNLWGQQMHRN